MINKQHIFELEKLVNFTLPELTVAVQVAKGDSFAVSSSAQVSLALEDETVDRQPLLCFKI